MLSGNTSIQVAITPERNFFVFENNSEDPAQGCYETRLSGTNFKGNDFTNAQATPASVIYSNDEAEQQCRHLRLKKDDCVPYENILRNSTSNLNIAFTGNVGDNLITFQASTAQDKGWALFRTFNRGATAVAMVGTNFEWTPEVKKFYEERRIAAE